MRKVYILVGTIGCGKTTWALNKNCEDPNTKIISADNIRAMLNGEYRYEEKLDEAITNGMVMLADELLHAGCDVIIDVCNLTKERRSAWTVLDAEKVAVIFPWKEKSWHVNNWLKSPKNFAADPNKIYDGNLQAFERVTSDEVDSFIYV